MSKLTVETDKYGLVRVKVETTKSGTPVTYRAPANTGLSGQNDQAIAAIVEKINETDDLIPQDTSSENQLVNEKALRELMLNTIGGRTYKTTKIGNQIWLAENLDFKFDGLKVGSSEVTFAGEPKAVYYNDDEATYGVNGDKYGLLYNWYAAEKLNMYKDQLIPGWHVPSDDDWNTLATAVGGASVAGTKLKSKTGWSSGAGNDDYGFSVFPAGYCNGGFNLLGTNAYLWTTTSLNSSNAYYEDFNADTSMNSNYSSKDRLFSIRLVRDA